MTSSKTGKRPPNIGHWKELQDAEPGYYKGSDEKLSLGSPFKKLGLERIGIHHEVLPPGRRTSWPHAESDEEEFVYVIEGTPDVWIDGELHRMEAGDAVAFPAGTGSCHAVINNTQSDVRLLVVGERSKPNNKVYYPLHPERKTQMDYWWDEAPQKPQGPHDGLPDALRK